LGYEEGTSESLLAKFYHLQQVTRQRHGMPPQPLAWFRNLVRGMGEHLAIHVASSEGRPVASILTLSFKKTMVYKYGCSDARYHRLGGMPFLFWKAIQKAKRAGFEEFDLGRSDADNAGLITFKDRLGAERSKLTYYRFPSRGTKPSTASWKIQSARRVLRHMPAPALNAAGRLLYKYFG
jgi:lipid II:glycine glycyltransferase (peptidoglycan interpeptide bridge formation enzyme)